MPENGVCKVLKVSNHFLLEKYIRNKMRINAAADITGIVTNPNNASCFSAQDTVSEVHGTTFGNI